MNDTSQLWQKGSCCFIIIFVLKENETTTGLVELLTLWFNSRLRRVFSNWKTDMNNKKAEYVFLWYIENYSFCWHKNGERLISPQFIAEGLEGTAWYLILFPRGESEKEEGYLSLYLARSRVDDGPEQIPIKFELSLLAENRSKLQPRVLRHSFEVETTQGIEKFLSMDEVLVRHKTDYLIGNTLGVRCAMCRIKNNHTLLTQITARTRIEIENLCFFHSIDDFSKFEPKSKKIVRIKSVTERNYVVSSNVYFTLDDSQEGNIVVEITSSSVKHILSKCVIFLIEANGNLKTCGVADNRADVTKKDIGKLTLSLTRKALLNQKNEYLPDDKLSLYCACLFSTGVKCNSFEENLYEITHSNLVQIKTKILKTNEELSTLPSALNEDLESVYNSQLLADIELLTKTKSFSAHKIVLCARSPVFKAMLTNDMRESNTDRIQIDDLEDDIVEKLLLFLYSDQLDDLLWETALKLYYAADKYEIGKLKMMCSSFLANNLDISTVTELLTLADTHNDFDLKKIVEDFILKHEDQVFGSGEWEKLTETNPQLVIKTMLLKYRRNKAI